MRFLCCVCNQVAPTEAPLKLNSSRSWWPSQTRRSYPLVSFFFSISVETNKYPTGMPINIHNKTLCEINSFFISASLNSHILRHTLIFLEIHTTTTNYSRREKYLSLHKAKLSILMNLLLRFDGNCAYMETKEQATQLTNVINKINFIWIQAKVTITYRQTLVHSLFYYY